MNTFETPASTLGETIILGDNVRAIHQGGSKIADFLADEHIPVMEMLQGDTLLYRRKAPYFFLRLTEADNNTEEE